MRDSALLGGSFDPVTKAHITLFHLVNEMTEFNRLIVIPAGRPNFKRETVSASIGDRINMLSLAIEDFRELYPKDTIEIFISRMESDETKVTYTSDTIKSIKESDPNLDKVNFVIGDDILLRLTSWHDFEYIKENVRFYVFRRERGPVSVPSGIDAVILDSPLIDGSSSEIRNGDFSLLTRRVREYVEENGLYRSR